MAHVAHLGGVVEAEYTARQMGYDLLARKGLIRHVAAQLCYPLTPGGAGRPLPDQALRPGDSPGLPGIQCGHPIADPTFLARGLRGR